MLDGVLNTPLGNQYRKDNTKQSGVIFIVVLQSE